MSTTATVAQTSNPARKVPTRKMSFEESMQDLPRAVASAGDLIAGHVIMALSSVFPDGEDYFVRSVRRYRDQITDPALKRQVAGFIGQEAVQGREHRVFNDRLAELVLSSEAIRGLMGADAVRDLFVWHALEESEHKAVAFDVHKAVGGGERLRVWTMHFFRFGFVVGMGMAEALSLLGDRATYRKGNLRRSWRRLKTSPLADPALWAQLKHYNRPDFHPDDSDTTELVRTWRVQLFGEGGALNDKLIGAAA
jgi:uncharacterized protein